MGWFTPCLAVFTFVIMSNNDQELPDIIEEGVNQQDHWEAAELAPELPDIDREAELVVQSGVPAENIAGRQRFVKYIQINQLFLSCQRLRFMSTASMALPL